MDPRLYTYERRRPRLDNPTYTSSNVNQSIQIFRGGPIDHTIDRSDKVTRKSYLQHQTHRPSVFYNPPEVSKIRSKFQHNRSNGIVQINDVVPLSNLSSYGREIMFPTNMNQKALDNQQYIKQNPERFFRSELFLDNKQKNYYRQINKMNDEWVSKSRMNKSVQLQRIAGKHTFKQDHANNDRKSHRYKHPLNYQAVVSPLEQKKFIPSRLNYADEIKGIL